jgi:hypothetical protein
MCHLDTLDECTEAERPIERERNVVSAMYRWYTEKHREEDNSTLLRGTLTRVHSPSLALI